MLRGKFIALNTYLKKNRNKTGGMAEAIESLLCKHEVPVQAPVPPKKSKQTKEKNPAITS
jgi:hypothetical protein